MARSTRFSSELDGASAKQADRESAPGVGKRTLVQQLQASAPHSAAGAENVQAAAERGTATATTRLPFTDTIQRAFGRHDVSSIQAHVGQEAGASARAMGAEAYATGSHVVFDGAPALHTAAHEAAHVVQQRAGVSLSRGVGAAGDTYEQHADAVADAVVRGESAEALLDRQAPAAGGGPGVQRKIRYPLDAGTEDLAPSGNHVVANAEELVELLTEWLPMRSEQWIAGTVKALGEQGRVYGNWDDVLEAMSATKPSERAATVKPVERDAAAAIASSQKDSSLAFEAAAAARAFLIDVVGRKAPDASEITKIGEIMVRIYTRVASILMNGVLSPKGLGEKGLAFTPSSDKGQAPDKISAWDIDLDRNQDQHYAENPKPVGHRSVSVAVERQDDVKLCGLDVCARAGKADKAAVEIVDKADLPKPVIAAVIDGTYKTKFGGDVDTIHLAVGRAARFTSSGSLTKDAQAEMTDRAFRTAMVISTGTRLDDHGPQQAMMAATAAELRTAGQIAPEALSHVLVPDFMKGFTLLTTLAKDCNVDLRFVGKTRAQILYYDFGSRSNVNSEIEVPDYQSELDKIWKAGGRKMVAHVTRT
jgi:hypothetical protein